MCTRLSIVSAGGAFVVTRLDTATFSRSSANWYTCRQPQPCAVAADCSPAFGSRDDRVKLITSEVGTAVVASSHRPPAGCPACSLQSLFKAPMPAPDPFGRTTVFCPARRTMVTPVGLPTTDEVRPLPSPVASNENARRWVLAVL